MNILLVKPYNLSDHIQPALGLGYLATSVRGRHNVRLVDCIKDNISTTGQLVDTIKEFKPQVLGIQCYTFLLKFVKQVFQAVKRINKDIICVVGGPHPSAVPQQTLEWFGECLDYAFCGEAEVGFSKFIDSLTSKDPNMGAVPGLIWRKGGKININPQQFVEDLDSLGLPAWDLIRPQTYPEAQHGAFFKKFPIAPIIVTRGCPYLCTFCAGSKVLGKKIRRHSIKYILGQIKMLYDDFGIREFHIIDDNFTFDMDFAKQLLKGITSLKLDISLATPNGVRLDKLDEELLYLMKKAGLYLISAGIESGSDRVLNLMKKRTTVSAIRENVNMIRRAGIDIAGFFIMGYPGETKKEIEQTIRFACDLDLVRANFFTFLPFPGTESFNQLESIGHLKNVNWDNLYFMSAPYVPTGMTRRQLKRYHRTAFMKFFLRPKIIFKNIAQIRSFRHFKFLAKRLYNWLLRG